MHFDAPKLVRSPGCDHGHDEESRNGRDIKIDILDDYIRIPEVFRIKPECQRVMEPPGELMGLDGPYWRERGAGQGKRRAPSP